MNKLFGNKLVAVKETGKSSLVPFILGALISVVGSSVQAEEVAENPYKKSKLITLPKQTHAIYMGGGISNQFMHVIAEKPTKYGHFYGKIGQFYDREGFAAQVGYRYPYKLTNSKKNNNGIYVGAFAGHVQHDIKDEKPFNRLGGGINLSYLWFDSTRIGALNLGVYFPAPEKNEDGSALKIRPTLQAGVSLSAGLF